MSMSKHFILIDGVALCVCDFRPAIRIERMDEGAEDVLPGLTAMLELGAEVSSARRKFPRPEHLMAALSEETGEVARALLDGEGHERVASEAIQVAYVAIRIREEGDSDF